MIKITTTKDLQGTEYKLPKETFIWVAFAHSDASETVNVKMTFHNSVKEAMENQVKKTDKLSEIACGFTPELNIKASELTEFTGLDGFKEAVQTIIKKGIEVLKLGHISKVELI